MIKPRLYRRLRIGLLLALVPGCFVLAQGSTTLCRPSGGLPGLLGSGAAARPAGAIGPQNSWSEAMARLASAAPPARTCGGLTDAAAVDEPASRAHAEPSIAAGNPVDIVTGTKHHRAVDLVLPSPDALTAVADDGRADPMSLVSAAVAGEPLVLSFARHYSSARTEAGSLGPGWSHSFETRLLRQFSEAQAPLEAPWRAVRVQVLQGDGRTIAFSPVAELEPPARGLRLRPTDSEDGEIEERYGSGQRTWVWRWPTGRRLEFDGQGRLAAIHAPDLDRISASYDADGRLSRLADRQGRSVGLEYREGRLIALVLPAGERIQYLYDDARRLSAVRYPDGRLLRHHYEDPRAAHRLSGITEPDGRRSRYHYDREGRVVESLAAGQAARDALRLAYQGELGRGETEVRWRDSLTVYRRAEVAGRPRLIQAEGPGCPVCPPSGLSYRHDESGRLLEQGPWSLRYDRQGRLIAVARTGDPRGSEWRVHYSADGPLARPVLIESASVVAGLARRVELAHNERGQLTLWRETGHAPGPKAVAPIEREFRYVYAAEGPAEGKPIALERHPRRGTPQSSPRITRLVWSEQRALEAVHHPGAIVHTVRRDALARPVFEALPDGSRIERAFDRGGRIHRLRNAEHDLQLAWHPTGALQSVAFADGERWQIERSAHSVRLSTAGGRRHEWSIAAPMRATPVSAPMPSRPLAEAVTVVDRTVRVIDADGHLTEYLRDDFGRTVAERSSRIGARWFIHDHWGQLTRIEEEGGRQIRLSYDAAGRLIEREERLGEDSIRTRLSWTGLRLTRIDHPEETMTVEYDDWGRLMAIDRVDREGYRLRTAIERDPLGRVIGRSLGDGLVLRYEYDRTGRLLRMGLAERGEATPNWLIERQWNEDGTLALESLGQGRLQRTERADATKSETAWRGRAQGPTLAHWAIRRNEQGAITSIAHHHGVDRFAHDPWGRLVVRESSDLGPEYFAYSPGGDVQARRDPQGGTERSGGAPQDGLGRPVLRDGWALHYGAAGRLARAERLHSTGHARGLSASAAAARAVEVRLAYNALGERVRKTVLEAGGHGQITGFAYFDQRLVAELDAQGRVVRHYLHWQGRPLAVIDIDPRRPGRVQSLHHLLTDPLGTPHRAIDTAGRIVWDARYQSYGAIQHARGTFRQPLRLPGQYHDEETGLYDNYLRTYDPHRGRYLEPDPLGLAGGLNRHAYVNGRPHAASDPLGLILFAFDGTENSRPARAPDTLSNVARLFSLYEGDDGHYMNGVGVDDPATGIRATLFDRYDAGSARARVDAMLEALDRALRALGTAGEEVTVDVIGFSRGAAMARDFSNSVAARIRTGHYARLDRCVSLNFVGLWDTVAQFGLNGLANDRWNLSIPDEARVVVHAVAANEHRRFFPLESILRSPTADSGRAVTRPGAHARSPSGRVRVEEAFVGDHADIGGSHGEGDLADVSLAWMYRHAKAAGVDLAAIDPQWEVVSHPLVHDNRSPAQPGPDREVRYRDAPRARPVAVTQRQMPGTALSTAQATELIRYDPAPRLGSRSPIVGEVDIAAYADWLDQTLGLRIGY